MSLLSRSLGNVESPSTPASAKKRSKARTPPRSVRKEAPPTSSTPTPSDTPHDEPLPTTPLRSSARIRSLGIRTPSETESQGTSQQHPGSGGESGTIPDAERVTTESVPGFAEETHGQRVAPEVVASEERTTSPWTANLEERIKKLKRGSPSARRGGGKSSSPHGSSASSPRRERTPSESVEGTKDAPEGVKSPAPPPPESPNVGERSTRSRQRSPAEATPPAGTRARRTSTKSSSSLHSSASTEIRLSPIPEDHSEAAREGSPAPSVASTVESAHSGPTRRRTRPARASEDPEEEEGRGIGRKEAARAVSPAPSVASTVGSSASGRVTRRSTRASVEREGPLTPTQDVQRSGRVRRRSETESPVTRRSARLKGGGSPGKERAVVSQESPMPPSDSDSEVSGYSSSAASSRSHLSAQHIERANEGEQLTLRSGRKRAPVTPSKSGARRKRGSASARFLVMPEENEEEEGIAAMDTAFVFSPPKAVISDPSHTLDVPKEAVQFTLSPPKVIPQPTFVATGRRRSMAARSSIASLGSIPEDSEAVPSTRASHERTIDVIVPATPPVRRGRSSLPSPKNEEVFLSSPRKGGSRKKSKGETAQVVEEQVSRYAEHSLPVKKRTRRGSLGSLKPIEETKDEEDIDDGEAQKKLHPILRNKRSSPTGSAVSEGAIDQGDAELEDMDSNRAKDDSDTLPRRRKSSSRKSLQPRKVIVPYKPRKSAKL